jgi:hypothetical protein
MWLLGTLVGFEGYWYGKSEKSGKTETEDPSACSGLSADDSRLCLRLRRAKDGRGPLRSAFGTGSKFLKELSGRHHSDILAGSGRIVLFVPCDKKGGFG